MKEKIERERKDERKERRDRKSDRGGSAEVTTATVRRSERSKREIQLI